MIRVQLWGMEIIFPGGIPAWEATADAWTMALLLLTTAAAMTTGLQPFQGGLPTGRIIPQFQAGRTIATVIIKTEQKTHQVKAGGPYEG